VSGFISSLQVPICETPPKEMQPIVTLKSAQERACYVTSDLLETLLPREAFELWAKVDLDGPQARRTRRVLRRAGPFVALVQDDNRREFLRLINRGILLEQLAASAADEPETPGAA
jgi:hypothetical protein